jgi:hypothetical protein
MRGTRPGDLPANSTSGRAYRRKIHCTVGDGTPTLGDLPANNTLQRDTDREIARVEPPRVNLDTYSGLWRILGIKIHAHAGGS